MKIPINQIRRKKKYPKGSLLLPEFLLFGKNDFIKDKCKLREEFRFYQIIEYNSDYNKDHKENK